MSNSPSVKRLCLRSFGRWTILAKEVVRRYMSKCPETETENVQKCPRILDDRKFNDGDSLSV